MLNKWIETQKQEEQHYATLQNKLTTSDVLYKNVSEIAV